jgi:sec-independent protein translocase protein TatB
MFDFAWSQIALIAVVALVVIGPKDMPVAIRAITNTIKKARRMAAEFHTHVDEMVREANLDEVRSQISNIRNLDFRTEIEKAVDPDRTIRDTFASDPFSTTPAGGTTSAGGTTVAADTLPELAVAERPMPPEPEADAVPPEPQKPLAPAFIPPSMVPQAASIAVQAPDEPPAFIPPEIVRERQARSQA